jgi:hypothetical protein
MLRIISLKRGFLNRRNKCNLRLLGDNLSAKALSSCLFLLLDTEDASVSEELLKPAKLRLLRSLALKEEQLLF